jgi:hypothetical protein
MQGDYAGRAKKFNDATEFVKKTGRGFGADARRIIAAFYVLLRTDSAAL